MERSILIYSMHIAPFLVGIRVIKYSQQRCSAFLVVNITPSPQIYRYSLFYSRKIRLNPEAREPYQLTYVYVLWGTRAITRRLFSTNDVIAPFLFAKWITVSYSANIVIHAHIHYTI